MRKVILPLVLGGFIAAGIFAYVKYNEIFAPNVPEKLEHKFLYIPTGTEMEPLLSMLVEQNFLIDVESFKWVADKMSFTQVKPGKYQVKPGWSNRQLVGMLRSGRQTPVKVVINNGRLLEDVAGKAAVNIEADSAEIHNKISDPQFLEEQGFTPETAMSLFIPNTYEFFWNTSAEEFSDRMLKEHKSFWSKKRRLKKAENAEMTPKEVYTLASIVERETSKNDEKARIAGVYINRLNRNIPLQADPTVVFALRQFDLRRVLNKHLKYKSPYNTYLNAGLPPGPISMASISSIDAVLDAESHDYIYFCAAPAKPGYHAFAKTLQGHNANARKYHKWLKERGIR